MDMGMDELAAAASVFAMELDSDESDAWAAISQNQRVEFQGLDLAWSWRRGARKDPIPQSRTRIAEVTAQ